jgi:hypothetical protein
MAKFHIGWLAAAACAGVLVICGAVLLGMIWERLCTLLGPPTEPFISRERMRCGERMQIIEAGDRGEALGPAGRPPWWAWRLD